MNVPITHCERCGEPLPAGLVGWQKFHASPNTCIAHLQTRVKRLEAEVKGLRQAQMDLSLEAVP